MSDNLVDLLGRRVKYFEDVRQMRSNPAPELPLH
jgi:hypothetical protein